MKTKLPIILSVFILSALSVHALDVKDKPYIPLPTYLCALPNINNYDIFANAGWDGNWYVGYNVCWIKKLPAPQKLDYIKAFVGAKIGRAKTESVAGSPLWDKKPIKGDIYISLASTPAWRDNQKYLLAATDDIPLEGDFENALEGVGEARWFWTEVPLDGVNFEGPNFIALWSPTQYFVTRDTAPILCGGWGVRNAEATTWLNDEITGSAPSDINKSLKTPISVFEPAIALKLVRRESIQQITIVIADIYEDKSEKHNKIISASIEGSQIERSWIEVTPINKNAWKKLGRFLYNPPYIFTIVPAELPEGKIYVRVACEDIWSNTGYSRPVEMSVERVKPVPQK